MIHREVWYRGLRKKATGPRPLTPAQLKQYLNRSYTEMMDAAQKVVDIETGIPTQFLNQIEYFDSTFGSYGGHILAILDDIPPETPYYKALSDLLDPIRSLLNVFDEARSVYNLQKERVFESSARNAHNTQRYVIALMANLIDVAASLMKSARESSSRDPRNVALLDKIEALGLDLLDRLNNVSDSLVPFKKTN